MDWPIIGRDELVSGVLGALHTRTGGAAVLEGELGVGKTRIAQTVTALLEEEGWRIERCYASEAGAKVPFGALSHVIPPALVTDPRLLLEQTRRAIIERADGRPLLLFIDDAQYLDSGSMALVYYLAASPDAWVLLTRRTGEVGNEVTITSLWKDRHAERIAVPPLDRNAHDELVRTIVGSVRAASVSSRLWHVTLGNPLFLRELLESTNDEDLERWLAGEPQHASSHAAIERLSQIVAGRTNSLEPGERDLLDLIAVAEPVPELLVAEADAVGGLMRLEELRLVSRELVGGDIHLRTSHPVYGATIRAMIPPSRRAKLAAALGHGLMKQGLVSRGDAIRAARWLIEANDRPPPELALRAATEALGRGDASLAEELSASAWEDEASVDALVIHGTAISMQNRNDEAREELSLAVRQATDDETHVRAALALARHLVWMERDVAAGCALLEGVIPSLPDAARPELRAELAIFSAVGGNAHTTVKAAADVLSDAKASRAATLTALIQSTLARCMLGDHDGMDADLRRAEELATTEQGSAPLALDQIRITRMMWLRFVDVRAARQLASAEYERSSRERGMTGVWAFGFAWTAIETGELDLAMGLADRAFLDLQRFDPFANLQMARSLVALTHALSGQLETARAWLASIGNLDELEPRSRVHADRASIWIEAAGNEERAAVLAIEAGQRAEAGTMMTWSVPLYQDAVRLGQADAVVQPLTRLARDTRLPSIQLAAEHARAAAAHDIDGLQGVARKLDACGYRLLGAEAHAQAARLFQGEEPLRAQLHLRAARLAADCTGAATPLLVSIESPLTERETEVARLAADGTSSRDIAERLYLSPRTVDNHLSSVYRKLGLGGREGLEELFV